MFCFNKTQTTHRTGQVEQFVHNGNRGDVTSCNKMIANKEKQKGVKFYN